MSIGLTVYGLYPRDLLDLAVAADELGFDAIWLGEHIVWADQVWPSGDLAEKRRSLTRAAEQLGLEPPTSALD
ncbi:MULTISPECIES: LLM class flavin-dependent oxidoreductase [unclassified Pseudofrankia]|uniref:LLM class flavin-dependent oxidoreductase n=1 Tax=unclassified Pseudofrankia TaxID=2994372 RepID=UPI0008DAF7D9|nr:MULTISPECIES: LLM class flavin-dependent oxidoreductase [unclassified Pseudofrankia]MDT3442279.1 LLM class flavin-dependent oxidoreductase [Pseudofrankia sp. BMG5.37]OHV60260.1 hypothetical protein BCD48_40855 [Pseudofrankia sp. BMG5.36]